MLPSKAKRLHWPIPDPAGHGGTDEEQLQRFRKARNEIVEKLKKFKLELKESGELI
jgi:arsenate reductase